MIAKVRHISDTKKLYGNMPTIKFLEPEFVYIALANARCPKAELFIKEGEHVNMCQVIGMRHAAFFDQPIHATVSGTFVGIEKHYHRNGKLTDFIKIQNDKLETLDPSCVKRSDEEIKKMTKAEMTEIIKNAALVGLGGSSFPTYIKFQTDAPIHTILVNAIECEPYITTDQRLMKEYPNRIISGIYYTMQAFNAKKAYICIKSKYKDLKQIYTELLKQYPGIELKCVGNFYPQGWEVAMIEKAMKIKMEPGTLPSKYGIMNFNVSTIVGIYKAIRYNQPVIARNISITGDAINYPHNFRVKVGTSVKELINKCGGYKDDKNKVFILGGPMMGAALPSDDCIITKTVTSVIVLNETKEKEQPCIRCGSCVLSCPTGLQPVLIMNAVKALDREKIKALNPLRCIECGLCSYACTSKIQVTDFVRKAKVIAKL